MSNKTRRHNEAPAAAPVAPEPPKEQTVPVKDVIFWANRASLRALASISGALDTNAKELTPSRGKLAEMLVQSQTLDAALRVFMGTGAWLERQPDEEPETPLAQPTATKPTLTVVPDVPVQIVDSAKDAPAEPVESANVDP